jgi:hypothetical protein
MRRVKILLYLPAFLVCSLWLCGCNTLANRRSLYAPKKGDGYWTRSLHEGTWKDRGAKPADTTIRKGGRPTSAPAANSPTAAPAVPTPNPEPLPEAAGGANQPNL